MSNCCDRFVMIEGEEDSFETWQGLRGPYYTPSVSEDGTLSWTNNGDLQNPANVNIIGPPGEQGPAGDPGPGVAEGGTTGQLLAKSSDEDYDTEWIDQPEMDAGHVSYDSTEAYDDGTVGKELTTINSALTSLASVTEIIDTASGAIASFPDGSGLPMRSLVAEINPVQDLHGYDAPWAGGAGKNLINQDGTDTSNGYVHNAYINSSGNIATASGAWDVMEYVPVEPNTTYTISGTTGSTANGFVEYDSSKTMVAHGTASTIPFTFTTGASTRYVRFNRQYSTDTQVQLEKGSSATSFSPYSNICPISGWTGLSGERDGKNLVAFTPGTTKTNNGVTYTANNDYTVTISGTATATSFGLESARKTLKAGTYTLSASNATGVRTVAVVGSTTPFIDGNSSTQFTITSETEVYVYCRVSNGTTVNTTPFIQIETGSTASTYEAYTSLPITVSWQTEAGTVYGGTVDVVTGVLTVTDAIYNPTGSEGGYTQQTGRVAFAVPREYRGGEVVDRPCSDFSIIAGGTAYCYVTTDMTVEELKAYFQSHTVQMVLPLTDAQTYQLTPQQISTLLGNNTVFVDCGSVSVTYQASIKGYIDKVLGQ